MSGISYELTEEMKKSRELSRSLSIVKDIEAGVKFTDENVCSIRPSYGLTPKYLKNILGEQVKINTKKSTPLK